MSASRAASCSPHVRSPSFSCSSAPFGPKIAAFGPSRRSCSSTRRLSVEMIVDDCKRREIHARVGSLSRSMASTRGFGDGCWSW